jgi:hypothetical protein
VIFASLRLLGLVRRGIRALESLAKSQSILASLAEKQELRATKDLIRPKPRPTELGLMDINETERRWQEQQTRDNVERG